MTSFKKKLLTLAAAAACFLATPDAYSAQTEPDCTYWVTTTTGWVCLSDRSWFIREIPACPAGHIWRVTQGDNEQLWECRK